MNKCYCELISIEIRFESGFIIDSFPICFCCCCCKNQEKNIDLLKFLKLSSYSIFLNTIKNLYDALMNRIK